MLDTKRIPFSPTPRRSAAAIVLLAVMLASSTSCDRQPPTADSRQDGSDAIPSAAGQKLLDDYSDPTRNKHGVERLLIDDQSAGSASQATQTCENGVLAVQGELVPGRGVPAFISLASPLAADGTPMDLTANQGVRLRVNVTRGMLSVQVSSAEISNYDFHTSAPIVAKRGEFQEVRIPFQEMKRGWSEQTALNLQSITSINLVSFSMAKDSFAYEVDEIGFY